MKTANQTAKLTAEALGARLDRIMQQSMAGELPVDHARNAIVAAREFLNSKREARKILAALGKPPTEAMGVWAES